MSICLAIFVMYCGAVIGAAITMQGMNASHRRRHRADLFSRMDMLVFSLFWWLWPVRAWAVYP